MAKLTNIRERVQQPFRDTLCRTSGLYAGTVRERNKLFATNNNAKGLGETNLSTGNVLPSDGSMIILALRCFIWHRAPRLRAGAAPQYTQNGDIGEFPNNTGDLGANNATGDGYDVHRLYWQCAEQLFWTFGAGQKPSIESMPSVYFPYGGGIVHEFGGQTDLVHGNNGEASQTAILKLARAVLLVPRQNITCEANIAVLDDGGNAATFVTTQGSRDMLNLADNLNAIDGIQKVVSFTFDGLQSRDVQLDLWASAPIRLTLRSGPRMALTQVDPASGYLQRSVRGRSRFLSTRTFAR